MNRDELVKLAIYQRERMEEMEAARKKEREDNAVMISGLTAEVSELNKRVSGLTEMLRASNQNALEMSRQISELLEQLKEKDRKIEKLQVTVKSGRKNLFGRKSQKGTKVKDKDDDNRPTPHIDVKDGFDGTPESLPQNLDVDVEKRAREAADGPAASKKESRLYRLGKTYRTMTTDNRVLHRSDTGKLPEGATVIKTYSRYAYNQETIVTEHEYEIVVYKDRDGNVLCGYFPMDAEKGEPIVESVPGTHAAPGLMAYLVFNRFFLDTRCTGRPCAYFRKGCACQGRP
jgi:hypothetical protein